MISEVLLKKLNDVGCIVVMAPEDLTKLIDENRELIAQRDELLSIAKRVDAISVRLPVALASELRDAIAKCEVKS